MKQLYVCSKPIMNNKGELHRHLIGTLSLLDNNEYQFSYNLDDSPICVGLKLSAFPDVHRIYNDAETRILLDDYLPSENDTAFISEILKKADMTHYDEWDWLLAFDADDNTDTETCLFETLPDDVIRHDTISLDEDKQIDCDEPLSDKDIVEFESVQDDVSLESESEDETISDDFESDTYEDDINELLELADSFSNTESENDVDESGVEADSSVIKNAKYIKQIDKSPAISHTVTVKKIYKYKRKNAADDFIAPPPENPIEIIQQRLLSNQKQRQEQLAVKLSINPYKNE